MKFAILLCLVAVSVAFPDRDAVALRDDRNIEDDGTYNFAFETNNGISRSEQGSPTIEGAIAKTGEIRYTLPDGQEFVLTFVADENGYRASSPFIPVAQK